MANRVADRAVQIFGGRGHMRETGRAILSRAARRTHLGRLSSEIQRLIIAGGLLKRVRLHRVTATAAAEMNMWKAHAGDAGSARHHPDRSGAGISGTLIGVQLADCGTSAFLIGIVFSAYNVGFLLGTLTCERMITVSVISPSASSPLRDRHLALRADAERLCPDLVR